MSNVSYLLDPLFELVKIMVGVAATTFFGFLAAKYKVEIDEKAKAALQDAVLNGLKYAAQKKLTGYVATNAAVEYAKTNVPDKIKKLDASTESLGKLAEALKSKLPADVKISL